MIPPIFVPSARDVSARLVAILAAVTSLIFARTHIFAALGAPLHNRIAGPPAASPPSSPTSPPAPSAPAPTPQNPAKTAAHPPSTSPTAAPG